MLLFCILEHGCGCCTNFLIRASNKDAARARILKDSREIGDYENYFEGDDDQWYEVSDNPSAWRIVSINEIKVAEDLFKYICDYDE